MTKQREKQNMTLWLLLGCGLALRLVLALVTEGYPYDMSCFVAWGDKLATEGPAAFYSEGYFADYPPGYLFVLGLVALVRQIFAIPYEAGMTYVLLAVVPSLCDCAAAALVWHIGREKLPESRLPLLLAAFVAFDPLLLFDTAVWKQIDGAFALPLLLCFYLLEKRRYLPAAVLYGVMHLRLQMDVPVDYFVYTYGPQSMLLLCYTDTFLHHLLPLRDVAAWGVGIASVLAAALSTVLFSYRQRRGSFSVMVLLALAGTIGSFFCGLGENANALLMVLLLGVAGAAFVMLIGGDKDAA